MVVMTYADAFNKEEGSKQQFPGATAFSTAQVTEQRVHAGDEHLVVASQGLWDCLSPDDAALRLHFHLKVTLYPLPVIAALNVRCLHSRASTLLRKALSRHVGCKGCTIRHDG